MAERKTRQERTRMGKGGAREASMRSQAWVAGLRRWGAVRDGTGDLDFVSYLVHIFFVDGGTGLRPW